MSLLLIHNIHHPTHLLKSPLLFIVMIFFWTGGSHDHLCYRLFEGCLKLQEQSPAGVLLKKVLEKFTKFTGKRPSLFSIHARLLICTFIKERDSSASGSLWILRNLSWNIFYKRTPSDFFWSHISMGTFSTQFLSYQSNEDDMRQRMIPKLECLTQNNVDFIR